MKKEASWKKIQGGNEDFQGIARLMVEFDEATGRVRRMENQVLHHLRKAASVCDPEDLDVYIRDRGGFEFEIVCSIDLKDGVCATRWIHEDGIKMEREEFREDPGHPVHSIVCMSDLYERYGVELERSDVQMLDGALFQILFQDQKDPALNGAGG